MATSIYLAMAVAREAPALTFTQLEHRPGLFSLRSPPECVHQLSPLLAPLARTPAHVDRCKSLGEFVEGHRPDAGPRRAASRAACARRDNRMALTSALSREGAANRNPTRDPAPCA